MRITLINQFYPPDLAPTGHLAASLAEHRAALGDEVTVVASRGGYVPESGRARRPQFANLRVRQLWTPGLGKSTAPRRLLDYGFFFLSAVFRLLTLPRQDLIISLTTPPFIALAGALHKFVHRSKLLLWSMDCYPEVLERSSTIRSGGPAARLMRAINRWLFRRMDAVVALDSAMASKLSEQYATAERTPTFTVIPNWEPATTYPQAAIQADWEPAAQLRLAESFVVLYLGNAGYGHRFETVLEAAERLASKEVVFLFVGGGEAWEQLHRSVHDRGLVNVHLLRYVPKEETPMVLASADCGLITMRDEYLGVISPSKLHAYLAMGLPIAYVGPMGGNVDQALVRFDVGASLRHGDVDGLVQFLSTLSRDAGYLDNLRKNARQAFLEAYVDVATLPQFDRVIDSLAD